MDHGAQALHATRQRITDYLRLHPAAVDSASGIHRWWLQGGEVALHIVEQALTELVAEGVVVRTLLSDGHAVYGARHRDNR
jgi:Fe2+ or Zn2+ uptake regulation protein